MAGIFATKAKTLPRLVHETRDHAQKVSFSPPHEDREVVAVRAGQEATGGVRRNGETLTEIVQV